MQTPDSTFKWTTWAVPGVAVAAGVGYLVAGFVGDNRGFGLFGLALMIASAVIFVALTRFSETARGLADRKDERINAIDKDATVAAGMALILAVIAMFMIEIAQGRDGMPYSALGALAGLTYVVTLVWLRFRR